LSHGEIYFLFIYLFKLSIWHQVTGAQIVLLNDKDLLKTVPEDRFMALKLASCRLAQERSLRDSKQLI
jgi:hypothetical protein